MKRRVVGSMPPVVQNQDLVPANLKLAWDNGKVLASVT